MKVIVSLVAIGKLNSGKKLNSGSDYLIGEHREVSISLECNTAREQ